MEVHEGVGLSDRISAEQRWQLLAHEIPGSWQFEIERREFLLLLLLAMLSIVQLRRCNKLLLRHRLHWSHVRLLQVQSRREGGLQGAATHSVVGTGGIGMLSEHVIFRFSWAQHVEVIQP